MALQRVNENTIIYAVIHDEGATKSKEIYGTLRCYQTDQEQLDLYLQRDELEALLAKKELLKDAANASGDMEPDEQNQLNNEVQELVAQVGSAQFPGRLIDKRKVQLPSDEYSRYSQNNFNLKATIYGWIEDNPEIYGVWEKHDQNYSL